MNALQMNEFEELEEMVMGSTHPEEDAEIKERFKVKDINAANWCLRKLSAIQKDIEEKEDLVAAEKKRLDAWLENEVKQSSQAASFFESLLAEYLIEKRKTDDKYKVKTPYGLVSTRKQQPKWQYDENKAIKAIEQAGGLDMLIKTEKKLIKTDIKSCYKNGKLTVIDGCLATLDGEVLEGITVTDQPDKIVIKCN